MQTLVKNYYDDETMEHIGTRFFINNEEVSFEEYREFVEENIVDSDEVDEEEYAEDQLCDCCQCEDSETCKDYVCTCGNGENDSDDSEELCQCPDCREERFFQLLTDTLNRIQDADGCPDCTMSALLDYTMEFQDMGFRVAKK